VLLKLEPGIERLLGVVYTPDDVASELTKFALDRLHKVPNTILEPSAGDGAFLRALAASTKGSFRVHGLDIDLSVIRPTSGAIILAKS